MVKSYLDISGEQNDLSASIYAFFDKDRYFFECGEAAQRVYKERSSIKIGKIKTIFLTTLSWDSIGGLIGVFYLLAGIEDCKEVDIYGPPGLYNVFYHSREFLNIELKVNIYEMNSRIPQVLKLEQLTVTTIPITNKKYESMDDQDQQPFRMISYHNYLQLEEWEALMAATCQQRKTMYVNVKEIQEDRLVVDKDLVMCYVGETNKLPGRFYPDRALALGVTKGPMFQALTSGKSVVTKDGNTVTSEQVMDPQQPGTKFAIIRCPSIEYLDSLTTSSYFGKQDNIDDIQIVVHLTPSDVLESERYQQFIKQFKCDTTKHIIVNNENCENYDQLLSSDKEIEKMRHFLPSIFGKRCPERQVKQLSIVESVQHLTCCQKMTRVGLAPPACAGEISFVKMEDEVSEDKKEAKLYEELMKSEKAASLRQLIVDTNAQLESLENKKLYPKVLFTGTGASKPSKERNVTGHLVETIQGKYMLLDCGEGTYGQLMRFFGKEKVTEILKNLDLIWISHNHADHHLGTPLMIERINQVRKGLNLPAVVLIAPSEIVDWLQGLTQVLHATHNGFEFDKQDRLVDECFVRLGIKSWVNAHVDHCENARGAVVEFVDDGFKLSYSGDTRPCENFITSGHGSDLMIHEATFEDDLQGDAIDKKHSTIGEALTVGQKMQAKTSICTHFSQKTKCLNNIGSSVVKPDSYGMSFDFLYVSPYQYPLFKNLLQLIDLEEELKLHIK
ncbi:hypothetical protein PPL_12361 [Heterostelium album PN500]|uniref:ribonuclease Z n=1 Tax=Heterostelium pallidum (strain ATCC 26659 / Pp 5 / PN500) TaxID=670386 RepID=D3BME1_HETP5|nr:hypothetical protein PPL_12361 [Heterostelium album PN500]EFA77153.1 hypothetical protein PPL_12361 [Heterostelium album PN500]|eukprot:XP_020429282.1 hypothetical protein PPL_12361 [Heterostelium album PN500]